jgi:DNA-binding NtrC family response regulator
MAIKTDFRILSATNHDLDQLVDQKKFRLDLLHRLNTLHIHIPPLRDRPEDIEPLLKFFAEDFAAKMNKQIPQIDKAVLQMLKSYAFPGNVRELKNMTERAIILSKGNIIGVDDFPVKKSVRPSTVKDSETLNLEAIEAEMIRRALSKCNNNQTAAASELGIQRMALVRKMQKYNITLNID